MRLERAGKVIKGFALFLLASPLFLSFFMACTAQPVLAASGDFNPTTPSPNIQIPGLIYATKIQTVIRNQEQYITIPYLAQYISAMYRYATGVAIIAAAIMIVYGGFLFILGASAKSVSRGKDVIMNAVIGLVLVFSSYMLLNTINPEAAAPKPIEISRIKPDPINMYMGANQDAPQTLHELGLEPRTAPATNVAPPDAPVTGDPSDPSKVAQEQAAGKATETADEWVPPPSTAKFKTDLTIPKNCPGRDPAYQKAKGNPSQDPEAYVKVGGVQLVQKAAYTISHNGKTLDDTVVAKYLEEQSITGVPAGAIMAQIMTESDAPKCIILNLFSSPQSCSTAPGAKYYNFGGVGCTQAQVPKDSCAAVVWGPGKGAISKKMYANSCTEGEGNASYWNETSPELNAKNCTNICLTQTRNTFTNCGENCYPQKSNQSNRAVGEEVWWPSVQCSRKFKSAHEFLASHLGFVKYCLPYNDSVYKFAYCIGASTYAGVTGLKGPLLAEIIERNCLCGSKDSLKCKRDLKFEENLAKGVVKKRNLNLYGKTCLEWYDAAKKRCKKTSSDVDYASIVKELQESTSGVLSPSENPFNDTRIRE